MDINVDLIKNIINSDELCDKVITSEYRNAYIVQIKDYILNNIDNDLDIKCVIRYIKKFVLLYSSKEDMLFDEVVLKLYSLNLNNVDFKNVLFTISFEETKNTLIQRYNSIISSNVDLSDVSFNRMIRFYCYVLNDLVLSKKNVDYFMYFIFKKNVTLNKDIVKYIYKIFAVTYSSFMSCVFLDSVDTRDPYYDGDYSGVVLYNNYISDSIDLDVFADILYQIDYINLYKEVSGKSISYTYEQLLFVKELCLYNVLGKKYFFENYSDISCINILKKNAYDKLDKYLRRLSVFCDLKYEYNIEIDYDKIDDNSDSVVSIDILFDQIMKRENDNLLRQYIYKYPILGSEYKGIGKKSLLNLLLDIYNNKKLLKNFYHDLDWYSSKDSSDIVVAEKIDKLKNKISICSSYIDVMNSIINNSFISSDDVIKSIGDLITYGTDSSDCQNDIYMILSVIIPKKIKNLCYNRNDVYIENFRKRVVSSYLSSMSKKSKDFNFDYFMKIYSCLNNIVGSFSSK